MELAKNKILLKMKQCALDYIQSQADVIICSIN